MYGDKKYYGFVKYLAATEEQVLAVLERYGFILEDNGLCVAPAAARLTTSAGSPKIPIYMEDGIPIALPYEVVDTDLGDGITIEDVKSRLYWHSF